MTFDPNFGKVGFAARLFTLRFRKLRINQADFAARFGLSLGAVKDLEQGRTMPTRAMLVLVATIERAPATVAQAVLSVRGDLAKRELGTRNRWTAERPQ